MDAKFLGSEGEHLVAEVYKKHGFKSRKLFILTHEDNKRAHAFYKKMGCKHETTLKNHYYHGKDERVYSIFF